MNKPVAWIPFAWYCAWIGKDDEPVWEQYEECHPASKEWDNFPDKIIPLYTHPVKELTDEEIISSAEEAGFDWSSDKGIFARHSNGSWIGLDVKMVDFAKAILRKAQQK